MIKGIHSIYKVKERVPINLDNIGKKIKQIRVRSKKTQQQIADECGISKSLLSKIENGQAASAIATLSKISDALQVPLSWVLDDKSEKELVLLPKANRQSKIGDENMGYSYELLASRSQYNGVEPTIVHVTPKHTNDRQEAYTHSQDEFIFILEGMIYLYYDGEEHYMEKGDSAYFQGSKSHLFIPVDNNGAKVLTLFIDSPL
ncbi:helix-turn-helix transcriptional regulator [Virgibacillus sp. NKC19-3]|uniref:helix-turn-helix domain-containing protein n=1 Tax=Virgibacillus saliphilus TaxID=2831674 RepID=UPI001C9A92DC|nr:XRE family transcriptional regulator [Virgibacillus sp. NKC19-3]MBY7143156.1 helix-turn-helix transcriptional regulator [Virgibacillus sp. NKC19-3]